MSEIVNREIPITIAFNYGVKILSQSILWDFGKISWSFVQFRKETLKLAILDYQAKHIRATCAIRCK